MKKLFKLVLSAVMATGLVACSSSSTTDGSTATTSATSDMSVAMITDSGEITDKSFNQTTYEASKAWSEENGVDFKYYKPSDDSNDARVQAIETAIAEGHNVIVMPGYLFAGAVVDCASNYPDVKFIALDCSEGDLLEAGVTAAGETYDYTPDNWDFEEYVDISNVYCAIYQEELAGYMAGYAAVKLGYTKLGFLGGMAVPAVMRYGYGYVQGADAAATELGLTDVEIKYVYGGKFTEDPSIKATMDTWYADGTEVVFGCGGRVYISAAEAAKAAGGKMIGVDVDQSASIDGDYGEGMTVTSAMKGLAVTVETALDEIKDGEWSSLAGKIDTLGLVDGDDPTANFVQIPMDTTQFEDGKFTVDDYKALVKGMYDGDITVSNDTSTEPTVKSVKVDYQGTILA
jgi:basic membrane protein A and related proteins